MSDSTISDSPATEPGNNFWSVFWPLVIASLGYFVDVFDLWLFANNRVGSINDLGIGPDDSVAVGARLINFQQVGLLIGALSWGVLSDRFGRARVMFGSIALYSVATLLNAFVTSIFQYEWLRLAAGIGLAGEIGVGITLIAESVPMKFRSVGIAIVTSVGLCGAVAAALATKIFTWREAYVFGGSMGLALLTLRWLVSESPVFQFMKSDQSIRKASIWFLFSNPKRVARLASCVAIGLPLYLCFGIFVTFAPEIVASILPGEVVTVADVLMCASISLAVGDLFAGLVSHWMKSRKRPMFLSLAVGLAFSLIAASGAYSSPQSYILIVSAFAFTTGYWTCLITATAEQFGTNLRATAATLVPNLIRASVIAQNLMFVQLKANYTTLTSLFILSVGTFLIAFVGLGMMSETYNRDLEFHE